MSLLIRNIGELAGIQPAGKRMLKGTEMAELHTLSNAWLLLENDRIAGFGKMEELPSGTFQNEIHAEGRTVLPTWCDSHTHIVYAASREKEFVDRIKGLSYEEIARRGGGILNSAKRLRETSEDELFVAVRERVNEIMKMGTGAVEIKSGYGLTVEDELKMLRVIDRLKKSTSLTIKANFLGAHAMPEEYKTNREGYIRLIIEEMLPRIHEEGLADFIDVFCDRGFYTPEETDQILQAGAQYGLRPKIHANELDYSGGIQTGVKNNALSVDHLEYTGESEIQTLLHSETMPVLLPSTAFFLTLPHYPPARKMIDAGLPVALASDYNPGSSPSGNMSFVLTLACTQLKMLPEEAINAATLNGAYAMGIEKDHGSITPGKKANIFITKRIPSYTCLPYSFGTKLIETVILNGQVKYHP